MYGLLWSDNILKSGIWGSKQSKYWENPFSFKVVQIKLLVLIYLQ